MATICRQSTASRCKRVASTYLHSERSNDFPMTLKDVVILSTTIQALYLDGEAGVELQFECQESGQGTARANMRGEQNVKTQKWALVFLCPPSFLPFTVHSPALCIDS